MPSRSVTEQLGIHYVYASYQPTILPSPHHMPPTYYGQLPAGAVDNRVLWNLDDQHMDTLFGATLNGHRASLRLPPVGNVRKYALTDGPWLAAGAPLGPRATPGELARLQHGGGE